MWVYPKDVEIEIIDGKRVAFSKIEVQYDEKRNVLNFDEAYRKLYPESKDYPPQPGDCDFSPLTSS